MSSQKGLVLLTGATGLVGSRVLRELLDQGYKVRLVVRAESKIAAIKDALPSRYAADELEFVVVPDMAVEGAFDEALQGDVEYILHIAAPMSKESDDLEAAVVKPSIMNTVTILHAAMKRPGIKKVVITSSVGVVFPEPSASMKPFDAYNIEPDPQGPWTDPFLAYLASKRLAYSATRKFVADKSPHFDVINIMPSYVIGPNGTAKTKDPYLTGSNMVALAPLLGVTISDPQSGLVCHVDDVSRVHVAALRPDVSGNHNFGVAYNSPNNITWDSSIDIVKRRLPELVTSRLFPLGGHVENTNIPFVATKTEEILGITFKSYEEMIVDVATAYAKVASAGS